MILQTFHKLKVIVICLNLVWEVKIKSFIDKYDVFKNIADEIKCNVINDKKSQIEILHNSIDTNNPINQNNNRSSISFFRPDDHSNAQYIQTIRKIRK